MKYTLSESRLWQEKMLPRAREISVGAGMYLRHRGFMKVRVNGLIPEGVPSTALHCRVPKI